MRRITISLGALGAVLALGLMLGSAVASAELPWLLPEATEAKPDTSTSTSGESKLESTSGLKITCKSGSGEDSDTKKFEGSGHITFSECKGSLGEECENLVGPRGRVEYEYRLHWGIRSTFPFVGSDVGLYVEVHLACAPRLVMVKGCVAPETTPLEKLTTSFTDTYKQTKGINEITKVEISGGTITCKLEVSVNGGAWEQAGLEVTVKQSGFKHNGESVSEELM